MRIAGVTIPDNKRLEIALTAIYGIGRSRARVILDKAVVSYDERAKNLSVDKQNAVRQFIGDFKIEGVLKREVATGIKRMIELKSYRGSRHQKKLPVRGQRTKTNSRTRRGNVRKTMGSGRRKLEKT